MHSPERDDASSLIEGKNPMGRGHHSRRSALNILAEERRAWQREVLEAGPLPPAPSSPRSPRRRRTLRLLPLAVVVLGIGGGVLTGEGAMGTALGLTAALVLEAALIAGERAS